VAMLSDPSSHVSTWLSGAVVLGLIIVTGLSVRYRFARSLNEFLDFLYLGPTRAWAVGTVTLLAVALAVLSSKFPIARALFNLISGWLRPYRSHGE
jgi:hypothetical protein